MKLVWLPALLLLSACATLTAESDQTITITTSPAGAHCSAMIQNGSWIVAQTPGLIIVPRSYSPLMIECQLNGLRGSANVEAGTRGRAYGNLLMLGLPAIVDASTGAGYEYSPENVIIELK